MNIRRRSVALALTAFVLSAAAARAQQQAVDAAALAKQLSNP